MTSANDISILIIDDEPLARKGMKEYIQQIPFLVCAGEYDNALTAVDIIQSGTVQALLLDIEMPHISGLNFIKSLQHPPPVIFTTAYSHYAVDSYGVNALDYLLKPISFERFLAAANKLKDYYEILQSNSNPDYFFIKTDQKIVRLITEEITYVEGLQNYVVIHTLTGKYISYLTIKSVEEFLDNRKFIRVHKSFIVAINKIESLEGGSLTINKQSIPISRSLKEKVMLELLQGKFLKR